MFHRSWFVTLALVCAAAPVWSADKEKPALKPYDGSDGYSLLPGSISPDGAYALACGSATSKPEELAKLRPWPTDLEIDAQHIEFADFLVDLRKPHVIAPLPDFTFFEVHDWHKNRGGLDVAWTEDSRRVLAISAERWDDEAAVWVEPATGKITAMKDALEKAYKAWLRTHEKKVPIGALSFEEPAFLGPDVVVLDATSEVPKSEDDTLRLYRLKVRLTAGKDGKGHCEILAGHKQKLDLNGSRLDDVDLNDKLYKKLRAQLPPKARAALDKEQDAWVTWSDAQPDEAQSMLIIRRSALLRARAEFPN